MTKVPKGFHAGTITIERVDPYGSTEIAAVVHDTGTLAYHQLPWLAELEPGAANKSEEERWYHVTHIKTGKMICQCRLQAVAASVTSSLAGLADWSTLVAPPPDLYGTIHSTLSSITARLTEEAEKKQKPLPRPPIVQLGKKDTLVPIFPAPPTPLTRGYASMAAEEFARLWNGDTEDGGSFSQALERAVSVQWVEELMVRVTQPPHNHLLPSDLPKGPHSSVPLGPPIRQNGAVYYLRDGTVANAAQFKVEYERLLAYGDRLQEGSIKLRSLYSEGAEHGWTGERLNRWERIDARFVSIVQEAWMCWSRAAYCFWASSSAFQAKVVAKIGHVGDAEHGWHQLGVKTILRHPEIQEVQPLRRELRARLRGETER
jgi:hypothetical protein